MSFLFDCDLLSEPQENDKNSKLATKHSAVCIKQPLLQTASATLCTCDIETSIIELFGLVRSYVDDGGEWISIFQENHTQ